MMPGATRARTLRSFATDPSQARSVSRATVRRIVAFAKPYGRLIWAFLALVIVDSLLVVATPVLFQRIVDDGVLKGDRSVVVVIALIIALLAFAEAGLTLAQRWYSARIGEGLIYDLRVRVYRHVQRMPIAFFTRTQTGALVSRLNNDVIGAQRAFTSTLSGVVANVITVVMVVGTMLLLSPLITAVALALLPLFLLPAKWAGRRLATLTRQQMELNADLGTGMTERFGVGGAMLVKLFGRSDEEQSVFSGRAEGVRDLGVRIAMSSRVFFSALTLIAALAIALVYGIGGLFAISGSLSVGTLLALAALMSRLYGPLTALANVRVDVMTALVSFERVFEVLDLEPSIVDPDDAYALPPGAAGIELDRVSFHYPRADEVGLASLESVARLDARDSGNVLDDVSVEVKPGQMVALVGPSGAGKTTITQLVNRLYDVDSGTVRIAGTDVREVSQESLRDVVGHVTQDAHLFHDTIAVNLRYARPEATDDEVWAALHAAQVGTLVRSLPDGLDTVVGDRGYRLSGGERQRIAIARLLLKAPAVVVLDEATAHLDSESEAAVQRALDAALAGRTSLVIAHRLSTVRQADLIVVLDQGRVVERGTHHQLVAAGGLYSELYRTQFADGSQVNGASPASLPA